MGNHSRFASWLRVTGIALGLCMGAAAHAGALIGDFIDEVVPEEGIELDEAHRQIKALIPPPQAIEGGAILDESLVQAGAPLLQELIIQSRDDALRSGVQPMPPDIRRNLTGFLPERVLNAARYRVQGGGDFTLQMNLIRYGEARAIALDYVIVFKESSDALYNPTLWVHELTHVDQYQRWGIQEFSVRYLRNYEAVEREAYEAETRYVAWASLQNTQKLASSGNPVNAAAANRPVHLFPVGGTSSTCGTAVAACQVNGAAPVGTPCWCNTPSGAAAGALVPGTASDDTTPSVPANACSTAWGACPLDLGISVGSPCTCFTPQGNFSGTTQQKSLSDRCATPSGTCLLAVPLLSGEPCSCPGRTGPLEGQVP